MIIAIVLEVIFLVALIAVDLLSKGFIMPFLSTQSGGNFVVWQDIIHFQYAENYGASFGIFYGDTVFLLIITIATMLVVGGILIVVNQKPKLFRYGLLTILGGGIGNIVDRLFLGYVRDFIDYKFLDTWFNIDFAIGNMADIFCIVGVFILIIYIIFGYKEGDLNLRFKRLQQWKKAK